MDGYDYIIVGAGTAGCVLANRLSADGTCRVLLLEAGRDDRRSAASVPAAWVRLLKSPCDWAYETEPNPGMDGRRILLPRGRVFGGSSGINAMIYVRGAAGDYDAWAAAGNPGWSYDDVLPYFRALECNSRGASRYHGGAGALHVADLRDRNPISDAFVQAARSLGIEANEDFNGARLDGVGYVQLMVRHGRRVSAADAFLRPVLGRRNLTVLDGVHTTGIVIERGRAAGVRYVRGGHEHTARADAQVFVSCGAIDSPKLLLLSGIGPAAELKRLGIDVVADVPGVGRNLQDHPAATIRMRCTKPISLLTAESPGSVARYLFFRRGALASSGIDAVAFIRTRPELSAPDVELLLLPVLWLNQGLTAPTEHGYTLAAALLRPKSRGFVTLRSADPLAPPLIHSNHFSDAGGEDMATLVAALRTARRIAAAAPLAALSGDELFPGAPAARDADLAAAIRAEGQTFYHPVGTCRMGRDPLAVVDAELRVHGIDGLRVADASIMPDVVRGHTAAAALMIGAKAADLVLGVQAGTRTGAHGEHAGRFAAVSP